MEGKEWPEGRDHDAVQSKGKISRKQDPPVSRGSVGTLLEGETVGIRILQSLGEVGAHYWRERQ